MMTREELRKKIAKYLFDCFSKTRLSWEYTYQKELWYLKADSLIEVLDSEGLGFVDWEAKLPKIPDFDCNPRDRPLCNIGAARYSELLSGWRPVRRLEP